MSEFIAHAELLRLYPQHQRLIDLQRDKGFAKYGQPLRVSDHRDMVAELEEEATDTLYYAIVERERLIQQKRTDPVARDKYLMVKQIMEHANRILCLCAEYRDADRAWGDHRG